MSDNLPERWKWVALKDVLDVRSEFVDYVNCAKMKFVGLEHLVSGENSVSAFQVEAEMRSTKSRFYPRKCWIYPQPFPLKTAQKMN